MTNQEYVKALREMADIYEANPELPFNDGSVNVLVDAKELPSIARMVGSCEKVAQDRFFNLRKSFSGLIVDYFTYREEVCERVITGKKVVPETIIPARPEEVIPEHEEEEFEWRCPESLLERA